VIHKINTKCSISKELFDIASSASDNDWIIPGTVISPILRVHVPDEIVNQCIILPKLMKQFVVAKCIIFKTPPYALYNWHTDDSDISGNRTCAINMLIHHTRSSLLIQTKNLNPLTSVFNEHVYQPNTLYVLNSNNPHSIINYEGNRYLLSLRVISPTYEEVIKKCNELNL
jgi:hypothetical protein